MQRKEQEEAEKKKEAKKRKKDAKKKRAAEEAEKKRLAEVAEKKRLAEEEHQKAVEAVKAQLSKGMNCTKFCRNNTSHKSRLTITSEKVGVCVRAHT